MNSMNSMNNQLNFFNAPTLNHSQKIFIHDPNTIFHRIEIPNRPFHNVASYHDFSDNFNFCSSNMNHLSSLNYFESVYANW
jgi:hypothetical protein